ncbi:MAG: 2-succinyl-6-hydroxy-2,4-cyclohexadiene-1-carboxylate synthase [Bacteroidia bacterium]|nr:2-succinyl-6-hydroxy-2,4-cyclohexadiene-1-carboxylate synthase [Bacteroidia bacterium]
MGKEKIKFRDVDIAYSVSGEGKVLVLLHGFLESKTIWNDFMVVLEKYFRVVCIDLPGHGESDCIGYVHEMEMNAEAVYAVLQHLNIKSCVMSGHSMGGYVTLAFAEKYPQLLKGICLFHSTALSDSEEKQRDRDRTINIVKKDAMTFIRAVIPNLFAPANKEKYKAEIDELINRAGQMSVLGIIATLEGMKIRKDRTAVLKNVQVPVLIIAGKQDTAVPFDSLLPQFALPKHCEALILDNVGHTGFIEAKEETLLRLLSFVDSSFKS